MARGPKKHLKRVNAPSSWMLDKMGGCFAPKASPGPHKGRECMPMALLLRNRLKYALTYKEVTSILMQRHVKVDGKVRTDKTFPVGFQGASRAHAAARDARAHRLAPLSTAFFFLAFQRGKVFFCARGARAAAAGARRRRAGARAREAGFAPPPFALPPTFLHDARKPSNAPRRAARACRARARAHVACGGCARLARRCQNPEKILRGRALPTPAAPAAAARATWRASPPVPPIDVASGPGACARAPCDSGVADLQGSGGDSRDVCGWAGRGAPPRPPPGTPPPCGVSWGVPAPPLRGPIRERGGERTLERPCLPRLPRLPRWLLRAPCRGHLRSRPLPCGLPPAIAPAPVPLRMRSVAAVVLTIGCARAQ